MTFRFSTILLCAAMLAQDKPVQTGQGQTGPVPPPEVDAALRARITQFYQAHVDGKFRVADEVVADDSKDAYFAAAKPRYHSFDVARINYSDDFKKADAVVFCKIDWFFHGKKTLMNVPASSTWKVVDGQWYWYTQATTEERQTPFGTMHYNSGKEAEPVAPIPGDPRVLAEHILQSIHVDKKALTLSSYEKSSGEVKITNGMQGSIVVRADINGRFNGLSFVLDKAELKSGESATLKIVCDPKDKEPKPTLIARIYVEPTNQVIPIELTFAIPPELEKQLPKDMQRKPSN